MERGTMDRALWPCYPRRLWRKPLQAACASLGSAHHSRHVASVVKQGKPWMPSSPKPLTAGPARESLG